MLAQALQFRQDHSFEASTLAELTDILDKQFGFVLGGWCGDARLRGRGQEGDQGDRPQQAVQPAQADADVHRLRQAVDGDGVVCQGVLMAVLSPRTSTE